MEKRNQFQEERKQHWMSLESRDSSNLRQLQNQEFYTPLESIIEKLKTTEFDRSTFLKLMGASATMMTVNCLPQPKEKIVPYVDKPNHITHGIPTYYASTCETCSAHCGILVKTVDGRPIKLEGNPSHPINQGALCASGQASILNLYDPDRAKSPQKIENGNATPISWDNLKTEVQKALEANKGKTYLFTKPIPSPTTKRLISSFLNKIGGGRHLEYSAVSPEDTIAKANEISYGKAVVPNYHFDKAKVIFSIEADFLGTWISPTEFTKQFSSRRKLSESNPDLNQLFVAESMPTVTGSNADSRYPIAPENARKLALAVAKAISELGGNSYGQLGNIDLEKLSQEIEVSSEWIRKVARSLYSAKGESLVVGNGTVDLQTAINLLNSMLDNDGKTVDYVSHRGEGISYSTNLEILKKALESGEVGVLFLYNTNLLYQLPEHLGWKNLLSKAKLIVSLDDRVNETASIAHYLAPASHYLESWGDSESVQGVTSISQPTINPLYDTRQLEDILITFAGGEIDGFTHYYDYLKSTYTKQVGEKGWISLLRSGFAQKGNYVTTSPSRPFKATIKELEPKKDGLSLTLYQTVALGDGTFANNPTLLELPDPITKVTWDNFVAISPALAKDRGIQSNDVLKVKAGKGVEYLLPAQVQPGLPKKTLAIALGYGRTHVGKIGNGVGKNTYQFANFLDGRLVFSGLDVEIEKTGKKYKLASTQDHHQMNPGSPLGTKWNDRPLILSTTLEKYKQNPASGTEKADPEFPVIGKGKKARGFNPDYEYKGYKWGMSVDLTLCTGCAACVIACQIENNIPTVGRDEVRVGREMHWMRIDRYYIGDESKPETLEIAHQPVMCQHCDNAPCETVCPVAATVHGSEGTNDMVYNRCIGTRYCSNNCPYKVRRYNWMEHWKDGKDTARAPRNLAFNPNVTVRSRGVMEKCTFCSSRIAEKKIKAKLEGRTLRDGELKTACQETCPADAIVFGDTNNKESQVSKNQQNKRAYRILDFLNIKPQVSYLTRVRNV